MSCVVINKCLTTPCGPGSSNGVDGNRWFVDSGIPLNSLGNDSDFYLDLLNSNVYEKINGIWVFQGQLQGAAERDDEFTRQADELVLAGQPVYITNTGTFKLAKALAPTHVIAGFALADINTGFAGTIISDGKLVLANWSNIIGSVSLSVGVEYFLSTVNFGQIIPTSLLPSLNIPGPYIVQVGRAIKSDTLDIKLEAHSIKL